MQRKNSLLKKKRNAFAMIMAITVIVIIASIMALSLALTTQTSKKTSDLYLYEQAEILSHSAAEYAVLQATLVPQCSYTGTSFAYNNTYDINVTMRYLGNPGSTCFNNANLNGVLFGTGIINYPASNGTIVMDITVSSQNSVATEPIRYFRRTIQKL